ncbi:MAG: restriction endonuclease subunit S [Mesorhizobium sp.]|uniref:restriction endonuclease subunit S n=1 Tax=Mesorhizobium sp. M7A.F.Ca.ET.027.02.1.1 TaxID=2496655 RepID=UPI000FD1E6E4|nr:restriction endonuclease subunit S [Mesorhizobium sp. M7A.F.Ca.ET.027.02.1.1]RVD18156.1 restriction endonuclease subunit S [Mesorhizobium sp. M7A.F.Ca.ET.027.02.1.1]RWD09696.1 MAG: restriction endonuclease subunit S [Mesorhizobium sp.]
MPTDDTRTVVGDYVTLVRGTTYKGALVGKPGPALLGLGSIVPGGGFRTEDFQTYGGDCPPELTLFPGDLYASLKGATKDGKMIGSVARVPPSVPSGRITQDTVKLVFRSAVPADVSFLHWVLRTPQYRDYCAERAVGSAVVALSRIDFLKYPVPPPSPETREIVALLDAVDDKIESNRCMAATLEEIARALFKNWFVDFGPVRAKVEARSSGLPNATEALFPRRFGDDGLPEGWQDGTLADAADLNPESRGSTARQGEIAYVDLANTKWGVIEDIQHFTPDDAPSRAQRVLRRGDTIVGTVRPGNGSYALIASDGMIGSTGFAVLRPKSQQLREFVYLAATSGENIDALAALADGGAYPAVRPNMVAETPCCLPTEEVLSAFQKTTATLIDRIEAARSESAELRDLRNILLANLFSGELRIKDAKKTVEAA